jgi:hypothetical protein
MSESDRNYTLKETMAFTEILRGGGQYRLSWDEIRKTLDELSRDHFSMRYPMNTNWNIFRGRIDNKTELFENVDQLSSRKKSEITNYGRCHKPAMSIFYGANNLDTVLAELKPEIGDLIHVAKARPKKEIFLSVIGELDHVRRYGKGLIGDEKDILDFKSMLNNIQTENNLKAIFLDAFMSELFITPAYQQLDYKATSALSDVIFSKEIAEDKFAIDGFAYPSVAHRGGINFAIRGSQFTEIMEIYECMTFKIVDYLGYGLYAKHQKAKSKIIDRNGKIEWEAR